MKKKKPRKNKAGLHFGETNKDYLNYIAPKLFGKGLAKHIHNEQKIKS